MSQWENHPSHQPRRQSWLQEHLPQVLAVAAVVVLGVVYLVYRNRQPAQPGVEPVAANVPDAVKKPVKKSLTDIDFEIPKKGIAQPGSAQHDATTPAGTPSAASEPKTLEWAATADPPPEDAPAAGLDSATFADLKPGVSPRTMATNLNHKLAAWGAEKSQVEVWDLEKKKLRCKCEVPNEYILGLALPTAERLIVWSESGLHSFATASGKSQGRLPIPSAIDDGAEPDRGIIVSPTGKYTAICRDGIRLYGSEDSKLAGIIPTPVGQRVLGQGFHPGGELLYAVYQSRKPPYMFRVATVDLTTGKETEKMLPARPGDLADPSMRGPIAFRITEQNRLYLFLGGRAILHGEDGRLVWLFEQPPALAVPLDQGNFWTVNPSGEPKVLTFDWARLEKLVEKLDLNRGASQVHPQTPVAIEIKIGSLSGNAKADVIAKLTKLLRARLEADGLKVADKASTHLVVDYSEQAVEKLAALKIQTGPASTDYKAVAGDAKATLPDLQIRWFNQEINLPVWTRKFKVASGDVTCTPAQAALDPEKGFAAAALDQALAELSAIVIPYYAAKGLVGGNETLPVTGLRLK